MITRILAFLAVIGLAFMLLPLIHEVLPMQELSPVAGNYVVKGPDELGAQNIVTSVVVTYRGLDTLGEVTVLFIATAGVGFLLGRKKEKKNKRKSSEILQTGASFLIALIFLYGIYVFVHGHLTPGGGFQGGVVIATGILLIMLSEVNMKFNHKLLHLVESVSGVGYVVLGILGLLLASTAAGLGDGFLNNRFLSMGTYGQLFSAGAIPLIYSLVGLKVGSELTGILDNMQE